MVMEAELMPWRTTLRGSRRAPSAKETLSGSLFNVNTMMLCILWKEAFSLVNPFGWMDLVSLQSSSIWVDTRKLNIFAKVVSAIFTEETMTARNARFDGHSIAYRSTLAHGVQDPLLVVYPPGLKLSTPSPTRTTTPAASCPMIQSPSKTRVPIRPVFQK